MDDRFNAWMPLQKSHSGGFVGILSDTSLDRDDEFMTKELLDSWASTEQVLPMLANHENKIEKLVGGWTEKQVISKGDSHALMAKPFFLKSNPLGKQTEDMVNEALEKGLNIGISIGAIPKETIEKEINGKKRKGYSKAEILEATIVPIQSNARSSFQRIAKQFDIELTKPKKVEECVKSLMSNPDFKPKDGKTKEESAWAVCQSKFGKSCPLSLDEGLKQIMEVTKMAEEEVQNLPEEAKEEPKEEPKAEEAKEAPAEEESKEEKSLKDEVAKLQKEIKQMKETVVNKAPAVEEPNLDLTKDNSPWTIEKGLRMRFGGE